MIMSFTCNHCGYSSASAGLHKCPDNCCSEQDKRIKDLEAQVVEIVELVNNPLRGQSYEHEIRRILAKEID